MADIAQTLDVRGLACPMPVVKTRLAIDKLEKGQVLEVLATDRGALVDIPAWAGATGHQVLEVRDEPDRLVFLVEN
jgi:tRNA 2-thiouridine synthesizing protein A